LGKIPKKEVSPLDILGIVFIMLPLGFLVIRLAGRKSLAEMTISQAVVMIAVGSLLVEPIKEESGGHVGVTTIALILFVVILYVLELMALESKLFERFWIGSPKILINHGKINYETMRKIRISETQLQMLLREKGIAHISDCRTITIEPNGKIGVDLYPDEQALHHKKSPNLFQEIKNARRGNTNKK
jgi:uncharacterized membrane protein YcaP (DUF421 family)